MPHSPVLIIDDSDDDFEATSRALKRSGDMRNPIDRCQNGNEAWDYLCGRASSVTTKSQGLPCLIFLDLNMPGMNGLSVLSKLRSDPRMFRIPVVVMTTSDNIGDIDSSYEAGANCYVVKPVDHEELLRAAKTLKECWLGVAQTPSFGASENAGREASSR